MKNMRIKGMMLFLMTALLFFPVKGSIEQSGFPAVGIPRQCNFDAHVCVSSFTMVSYC